MDKEEEEKQKYYEEWIRKIKEPFSVVKTPNSSVLERTIHQSNVNPYEIQYGVQAVQD